MEDALNLGLIIFQKRQQRRLDDVLARPNPSPSVRTDLLYCLVDLYRQLLILVQVIVNCSFARRVQSFRRLFRLPRLHLLRKFGDALQVLLIFDRLRLPVGNDLVQQGRHLLIKGRVVQVLLDDLSADVVLDGFRDGVLVALQSAELRGDGIGNARLHDQVQQADIVEGRNLSRLIGLNVGVDQVPHVSLVSLQVEALAAGLANDLADIQVMVKLLLDAGYVGLGVSGPVQFVGDIGIGPHQPTVAL